MGNIVQAGGVVTAAQIYALKGTITEGDLDTFNTTGVHRITELANLTSLPVSEASGPGVLEVEALSDDGTEFLQRLFIENSGVTYTRVHGATGFTVTWREASGGVKAKQYFWGQM